ncbi:ATP-binding cassette domain-containing protein [Bradyrhizobium sp. GCM10027634]|uniref:branched-chain amino acid ABC transporter ATP-binding protein/permease n=1 Tax=unclassified Bradyrhizobium TaxID=2631580 RepID=UPI00263B164A|nr:branched-chain amino acid ABC transporter ATP-binding protein/permease [Bradyrhizobium sp. WYCCWR 12677]MDN4999291.1 branched-chain amino acid ABC transporter ATP-binding protein/permease [Bradyrhizobium sp. WYCCWR 12677]
MKNVSTIERLRPLLIAIVAIILLPLLLRALGLSLNTGTWMLGLAIAAMGLNLCIGYTGLVSFGHSTWFGVGAYAAGLIQLHFFPGEIWLPLLGSMAVVAIGSTVTGLLILRRRGVYFSLLTLALAALVYTTAFRWTSLTGGEDGLGGLTRGGVGSISFDSALNYYIVVAVIGLMTLFVLMRLVRSPFGHVLVAIRENQLRASFQGYPVERYKLAVFVISAVVTGLAGALIAFLNYLVSADAVSVPFAGELLAMVVIGGMRSLLGPALGALFFILFRELFSIWTSDWLFWFGLTFVAFVMYSPGGLVGVGALVMRRFHPPAEETAAMSRRKIYDGLPLPDFLRPEALKGTVLEVSGVCRKFGGIRAVENASLKVAAGEIHALIGPNGAGKTTLFNLVSGLYAPDNGTIRLRGRDVAGVPANLICHQGLARSFQITNLFRGLSIYENLRLSLQAQRTMRFNVWNDIDAYEDIHAETAALVKFLGLQGIEEIEGGELSYGGQRLVDLGIALGSKPQVLLLDEPLAGLAAAERERVSNLVKNIAVNIPVLIVEHDIDRVLGFSQVVTVMNQGEVLMSDCPGAVRSDLRVQEIYTGKGIPAVEHRRSDERAGERETVLRLDRVNTFYGKSHILNDAALDVREGEIVALLGRNGAGKSTLLKTIAGLVPPATGSIAYRDRDISRLAAPDIARHGIGYVPQGRGLFAGMTVRENLALGRLARQTDGSDGVVWDEEQILHHFPRLKERMHIAADYLSGGEQQMVAVARAMSGNVRLLLLDEPFEGLAPAVTLELFRVFDQLRRHMSIVIVEHNLDLVLALADRVFALERGAVFHQGPAAPLLTDVNYRKQILWL